MGKQNKSTVHTRLGPSEDNPPITDEIKNFVPEIKQVKPLHVKPTFYSYCYESLKSIAKEFGYNLLLHGSVNRDLDLIAVPWVDNPKDEVEMLIAFQEYLCGFKTINATKDTFCYSVLPGGRNSYVISMNRAGKWNNYIDEQYYVDISITPLIK